MRKLSKKSEIDVKDINEKDVNEDEAEAEAS